MIMHVSPAVQTYRTEEMTLGFVITIAGVLPMVKNATKTIANAQRDGTRKIVNISSTI
jgi:hypothetical protein